MPKQILFVQGGGENVHDQWDNALVNSLRHELGPGYDIAYPRKAAPERRFYELRDDMPSGAGSQPGCYGF